MFRLHTDSISWHEASSGGLVCYNKSKCWTKQVLEFGKQRSQGKHTFAGEFFFLTLCGDKIEWSQLESF